MYKVDLTAGGFDMDTDFPDGARAEVVTTILGILKNE